MWGKVSPSDFRVEIEVADLAGVAALAGLGVFTKPAIGCMYVSNRTAPVVAHHDMTVQMR